MIRNGTFTFLSCLARVFLRHFSTTIVIVNRSGCLCESMITPVCYIVRPLIVRLAACLIGHMVVRSVDQSLRCSSVHFHFGRLIFHGFVDQLVSFSPMQPQVFLCFLFSQFGFIKFLSDLFDAPEPVMRYLYETYRLYNIPIAKDDSRQIIYQVCFQEIFLLEVDAFMAVFLFVMNVYSYRNNRKIIYEKLLRGLAQI